ncbi:MAG: hypothetical protein HYX46_01905 [Betaproteobacteria bacterium]|nr:hypothetical protein [Betaproteobacteria bacterium]
MQVEGQPEPVPAEWVATPEGKFAHSIKVPNPVPKESGYRKGMTSEQYFDHLCKTEAGEFIYKTAGHVEGFYFMRPPRRPTDDDLKDRYKLEAPEIERTFQLRRALPESRGIIFVNPPWALFTFVEEPNHGSDLSKPYVRVYGYHQDKSPMLVESTSSLTSNYGLVWRGVKRPNDRELALAGSEWIVLDLKTREVLALQRDYGLTGRTRNTPRGVWWLNAVNCPQSTSKHIRGSRFYEFVTKSLKPKMEEQK